MLVLLWSGTGYITPLIGGVVADVYLGRFKTIFGFIVLYVLSMALLAVGVLPELILSQSWITYTSLFLIAVAMGGIKANVVTFGADQFQKNSVEIQQAFFNWFYFSINCGSLISFIGLSYVVQNISISIGLMVPAIVMFVAAILIIAGYKLYVRIPPSGSVLSTCIKLVYHCIKVGPKGTASEGFLDRAKYLRDHSGQRLYSDEIIEDVKTLSNVFPIQACLIVFWCTYAQMNSVMFSQGTVMYLHEFIPVSSLNTFNAATIIILVPIFDRFLYPCLKKFNMNFNSLRRIGIGLVLAILSMLYCGVLEIFRKKEYIAGNIIVQTINEKPVIGANMSIFWQAPGFFFIGCGEVLASITGLQFAYDEAPTSMRSIVQATNLLSTAFGSYLGLIIVAVVNSVSQDSPWIADDINKSHLDLYFLTLCVLGILNFYLFGYLSSKYKFRKPQ